MNGLNTSMPEHTRQAGLLCYDVTLARTPEEGVCPTFIQLMPKVVAGDA